MPDWSDWLKRPVRMWEVIAAEANGITVLALRQEWLRRFNLLMGGNKYVN
jgi:hypothetical protein